MSLFALPTARKWRRDGRRAIAGAKMRVGKFVHFSGNASPSCDGKVTRDRQDTWGARQAAPASVRSRVSFVPPVPSRNADNPSRFMWPADFPPRFYTLSALLLSQFSAAEPGRKLLMPGITRRKPQLRRFERLTAMRAISGRGWLSAGRSERWTRRKNAKDSRDPENLSWFFDNKNSNS